MQINSRTNYNIPNFKAQKVAKVKNIYQGLTTHIDIYKIKEADSHIDLPASIAFNGMD